MPTADRMCDRDAEMRRRFVARPDDPRILAHIAGCTACRETLDVATWMRTLAEIPIDGPPLPTAAYLRWRADILRRWDSGQRAVAPMNVGCMRRSSWAIGAMFLWPLWRDLDPLASSSTAPAPGGCHGDRVMASPDLGGRNAVGREEMMSTPRLSGMFATVSVHWFAHIVQRDGRARCLHDGIGANAIFSVANALLLARCRGR